MLSPRAAYGRVSRMIGQRALLVVDVQRGFEDPALGSRDNPHCEENVAKQRRPLESAIFS